MSFFGVGVGGLQTPHEPEGTPYIYTYYEHTICLCTISCTFTFEYSDRVSSANRASQKVVPLSFLAYVFLNGWELFFDQILHASYTFLPTIDYTFLFN